MAKTIKFNLICDEKSVRTIEDLQNNFVIEEILQHYNSKILHKWLTVRGYQELEQVNAIKSKNSFDIIMELAEIFQVQLTANTIKDITYYFDYKKTREIDLLEIKKLKNESSKIIKNNTEVYYDLLNEILNEKTNMPLIKANIRAISKDFFHFFLLDFMKLFSIFLENAPLAIFAMFMQKNMREIFFYATKDTQNLESENSLETEETQDLNSEKFSDIVIYQEKSFDLEKEDADRIMTILKDYNYVALAQEYPDTIKVFTGATDEYWKDLESKNKKYMILSMETGCFIRSSNTREEEFDSTATNNYFLILDGIDYKSNFIKNTLYYVEV